MSKTVEQIYAINPTTVVADTDLYYLVQSPYTPGFDAAITGASLKAAFGAGGTINPGLADQIAYYASAGTTISGLTGGNDGVLITGPTGTPSISSTLPLTVQSNITRLGTITSGIWHGTIIGGTYGGTGINNGASTITIGGNFSMVGAFTFAGTLTGNTAVTFPTSGTLATTSQLLVSPLTTKGDLWGWSITNDRLPVGSTNGQILQVNSAASLGLSYSTATYPSVATSAARILRADGTNWVPTTSTFADTYTASSILYANGANNIAGLTTANNGLLVTGNTGVPSLLAGPGTTGNVLISNAAAAPSFSTFTFPTTAGASGSILISNGTNIISSTSLWPNTVGTSGTILRSNGTSNAYTTSTFADTYSANTILYASSANTITGLATSAAAVLTTVASVPTWAAQLSLALGGTNASLTASNGGIVWSNASQLQILAGTSTAGLALVSGASGAPSWSTNKPFTQIGYQVFTTTGANTYTPTAGTTLSVIELWGAGGGGGSTNSAVIWGNGGGAGAYSNFVQANPTSVTISIGTGGTGGLMNNGTAGTDGGDTTYNSTTVVAKGGVHAANGVAIGGVGGSAASGTGDFKISGGMGQSNGLSSTAFIAGGGSSPRNVVIPALAGSSANAPANSGGGGSAGNLTTNASNGGSGYAIVTEYRSI